MKAGAGAEASQFTAAVVNETTEIGDVGAQVPHPEREPGSAKLTVWMDVRPAFTLLAIWKAARWCRGARQDRP